ncbi:MAG: HAMP domain-containing histidine kinase [Ruminococcus sp.]|nr:HAMP domain-containing histidine kinase [Ruminococcus sp.]
MGALIRNISIYVFIIILAAGLITLGTILLLRVLGYFPSRAEAPIIYMSTFIVSSAVIGTVISHIVFKRVLSPLDEFKKAISEIERGNFNVSVSQEKVPEIIAELFESFNKMAKELSGTEMFRSDFINSFSHEFKTPIVSIEGFARRLKKENLPEEKRREYIDIIISESKRLTNLSTNILMLNKFENQEFISDRSTFYIDEQIRSCILLLEKQWTKKQLDFDIELEPLEYFGNQEMLSQVWLNIIGNSIKFSGNSTTVTIRAGRKDGRIRISISDQGEGMDEDTLRHIFERFYQGDSAHASEGNGLGLPLVKRIVELCGGSIRVASQKGKGTEFSVFL